MVKQLLSNVGKTIVKISAKNNNGIDKLFNEIEKLFDLNKISQDNEVIITNERHKNQINKAIKDIDLSH